MRKILIFVMLLVITSTFGQPLANRYILTTDVLTVTEADRSTFWTMTFGDVVTLVERNLDTFSGELAFDDSVYFADDVTVAVDFDVDGTANLDAVDVDGKMNIDATLAAGASNGHLSKITMAAGLTYTGTMAGLTVKNYDADATVVHGSGENTGLAVFMKQMSASGSGGENSLLSLHSHASAIGKLDHGIIVYPDTVGSVFAVRAAVIDYGLDFADRDNVTVNNAEIRLSNGETIDNATDGVVNFSAANVQLQTLNFGTLSGGTADSLYVDFTPDLPALTAGLEICFVADSTNTAAATITVDGTEKNIYEASDVSAVDSGDIVAGMVVRLVYDGTQWQQISQSGN